jgi:hypothetical protein
MPFFIKEGFSGVIPKGTPFAQLIPVKRENWLGVYDPAYIPDVFKQGREVNETKAWYKKKIWEKKHYDLEKGLTHEEQ